MSRLALAAALLLGLAAPAVAASCLAEIGRRGAETLVRQCREVSPATRPPCNVANACALMRDEIARGCGMLGSGAPAFCPAADEDDDEE